MTAPLTWELNGVGIPACSTRKFCGSGERVRSQPAIHKAGARDPKGFRALSLGFRSMAAASKTVLAKISEDFLEV